MNSQRNSTGLTIVIAALLGILFGLGLGLSEMVNPARVIGFLDVAGRWDPTLVFVLGGALAVSIPGFQFAGRIMRRPVFESRFLLPTRKDVDGRLLGGAALFGVGWGLAGLCPGPAIVDLSTATPQIFLFVAAMLTGMLIYRFTLEG